jgi:hypothetical protein
MVILMLVTSCIACGFDTEEQRKSLAGLQRIEVVIEKQQTELESVGLTAAALRTDVELKLRLAGIKVITPADAVVPGFPALYVNVLAVTGPEPWAWETHVALLQKVRLDRDQTIVVYNAVTWWDASVGIVGSSGIARVVRNATKDLVDKFINAYLSVNPKQ